jgi:hypothetical protein
MFLIKYGEIINYIEMINKSHYSREGSLKTTFCCRKRKTKKLIRLRGNSRNGIIRG